ncbi:homeobox-leucine zipper protein HOX27 [Elaeis guineensis]|uniref:Homeobox-leucine zipper protein HOX11 n=1 Tax=Elaeis guineensis var. tenera TaxID=51953 RepID=A0A6I9QYN8_ELAGV|nr:homeobox-leucine zipper protein HOX11 [Elaeis guineensis]
MELGLSLGEAPAKAFFAAQKAGVKATGGLVLGFGMGLGVGLGGREEEEEEERGRVEEEEAREEEEREGEQERGSAEPPVQLNLLPLAPVPRRSTPQLGFPWAPETRNLEVSTRGFDVNQAPSAEVEEGAAVSSSPNSTISSFQMDFSAVMGRGGEKGVTAAGRSEGEVERTSSRASDEEENGLARKKLRLSKEQSAFLEESFKEHNTLNPKQKLALAKQLNLRPRQVEVWFQNRRARTKLKQTEVDCEYLKRCCETLTEENRRLQKELAELRALKTSHPFYMHLPATTLSMCPSCERVASTTTTVPPAAAANAASAASTAAATTAAVATPAADNRPSSFASLFSKPRFYSFQAPHSAPTHQPSAAS